MIGDPPAYVTVKAFSAQYIEYETSFFFDMKLSKRSCDEISNDVMIGCRHALRDAGMTFSTDVTSGLEILSAPDIKVGMLATKQEESGEST